MVAAKRNLILVLGLTCQIYLHAQKNVNWTLPKHQFQAQFGMSNNKDYLSNFNPSENFPYLGLIYQHNFSRKWYASADVQFMQGVFQMGIETRDYTDPNNVQIIRKSPSADNPWRLPIVRFKEERFAKEGEIKTSQLVQVNSPNGIYRRINYNINGGFMRVTHRNMLRIGVGVSYYQTFSRDIVSFVMPDKEAGNMANLPYLRLLELSNWSFNARVAYDFFLTSHLSVGLQLNTLLNVKYLEPMAQQAGITVGYQLTKHKSVKKQPKV